MSSIEKIKRPENTGNEPGLKLTDPAVLIQKAIGIGLVVSFISPVIIAGPGIFKLVFMNIEALGKVPFTIAFLLIYPLLAGVVTMIAAKFKRSPTKSVILLATGLTPFLILLASPTVQESVRKIQQGNSPEGLSLGIVALLSLAAFFLILAGAYALWLKPEEKKARQTTAVGGALLAVYLLVPINGKFSFIEAFKFMFANDPSGAGLLFIRGLVKLVSLVLAVIIVVRCLMLLKPNKDKQYAKTGKDILILWLAQFLLNGIFFIYVMQFGIAEAGGSIITSLLAMFVIILKIIPWIFGLIFLIPLGLGELLLQWPEVSLKGYHYIYRIKAIKFRKSFNKVFRSPLTRIFIAIFGISVVSSFIAMYFRPPPPNPRATANLLIAAGNGNLGRVKRLIKEGADINVKNPQNKTPLHLAAEKGYIKAARALLRDKDGSLRKQVLIDTKSKGWVIETPLCVSARRGDLEMVRLLLTSGADPNFRGRYNTTPLLAAAQARHTDIVRLLLEHGADVNAKDSRDGTALRSAIYWRNWQMVDALVQKGADINVSYKAGKPLFSLMEHNRPGVLMVLILRKVNVKAENDTIGFNLLKAVFVADIERIRLLLKKGYNIDGEKRGGCFPPLNLAAQEGHTKVVQFLLKEGAKIDVRGIKDRTVLHRAVWHERNDDGVPRPRPGNKSGLVRFLIKQGAHIDARDQNGNTPLHEAVRQGTFLEVEALVENGADVNAINYDGQSVLEIPVPKHYDRSPEREKERKKIIAYVRQKAGLKDQR